MPQQDAMSFPSSRNCARKPLERTTINTSGMTDTQAGGVAACRHSSTRTGEHTSNEPHLRASMKI